MIDSARHAARTFIISMDEFHELEHLDYILHPCSLEIFSFSTCAQRESVGVGERKVSE